MAAVKRRSEDGAIVRLTISVTADCIRLTGANGSAVKGEH